MRKIKKNLRFLIPIFVIAILLVLIVGCESQEKKKLEERKAYAHREIEEAYNKGNLDVLDEYYANDFIYHLTSQPDIKGLEAYKKFIDGNRIGYPDIQITIDDVIAEGDIVAMRYTYHGTQTGQSPTLNISTGKNVTFTGCAVIYWRGDKIIETWNYVDYLGLMRQLGFKIVPPQEPGEE
jgi:predicted ester cyclase